MRRLATAAVLAAAALAAGCGRTPDPPGALTADDQRLLNDAAAMLDANSIDVNLSAANESDPR